MVHLVALRTGKSPWRGRRIHCLNSGILGQNKTTGGIICMSSQWYCWKQLRVIIPSEKKRERIFLNIPNNVCLIVRETYLEMIQCLKAQFRETG
jgi:hypothetical protein